MQHHRDPLGAVLVDIVRPEPLGHVEVHLQRPALPVAANRVPEDELELRSVDRALPLVHGVLEPRGTRSRLESRLRAIPNGVVPDPLRGAVRVLDAHVLEAEVAVDVQDQPGNGHRFGGDLILGDEYVAIVLGEGPNAHQAMESPRGLVAVHLAELCEAHRELPVAAQPVLEDLHVARAVHGLDGVEPLVRGLGEIHVLAELLHVARLPPELRVHELRGAHLLVPGGGLPLAHVPNERLDLGPAPRMPDHRARRLLLQVKQVEVLADAAVIALLRFLEEYLKRLEEAEKRDHRRIGKDLDLFHLQEEAPGAVVWHPRGWTEVQSLIGYMRERQAAAGYEEVSAPELMDAELWRQSGHMEKFGENMYLTKTPDERLYAIKPMNCPGHVQIFKHGLRSYRELPVRFAEFGKVHRYEPSGALHGLMRVRAFTQDDGHVFVTEDQITSESVAITRLILDIYRDFGFEDVRIKYADRPPKRVGNDAIWDRAEAALKAASSAAGIEYTLNKGEGAFYGPKLEFVLRDAIGRDWQCGTLQVDLNMPERLGAYYIDEHSAKRTPVMLHRAMFGSLERFLAILLEHHAGKLPAWLSPVQAVVIGITERQDEYVLRVTEALKNQGLRVESDLRNEKVGFKIREHTLRRVPYLLVAGDKEVAANLLSVRTRSGKDLGTTSPETFAQGLRVELDSRGRKVWEG